MTDTAEKIMGLFNRHGKAEAGKVVPLTELTYHANESVPTCCRAGGGDEGITGRRIRDNNFATRA